MNNDFLQEILGEKGVETLKKAIDQYPALNSVITPRAVLAWISTMGQMGYDGQLPGIENSYFSLIKSENDTYAGALTINNQLYTFTEADLIHVTASVGVALGIQVEEIDESLKKKDLTKLGKSIDLLVKTEILKKIKTSKKRDEKISKRVKLAKNELLKVCPECEKPQIKENKFVGCFCFSDLSKNVSLTNENNDFYLEFDKEIDNDAISALVDVFKG